MEDRIRFITHQGKQILGGQRDYPSSSRSCDHPLLSRRMFWVIAWNQQIWHSVQDDDRRAAVERRLSPEDICFAQLGERESFRLFDGDFKLFSIESRGEP